MKESTKRMGERWIWRYQTNKQKNEAPTDRQAPKGDFSYLFPCEKKKSEPLTAVITGPTDFSHV